jgi:Icc-related predicted phosphoesterase
VRLVFISDTHLELLDGVPDGDILVHCGDYSFVGTENDTIAFNSWLKKQPHSHKIVIPGNHDWIAYNDGVRFRQIMSAATVLIDEEVTIEGLRFYGSPWTPKFGTWAFMRERWKMDQIWNNIPDGIDVLITHGPPRGILDEILRFDSFKNQWATINTGCLALSKRVLEVKPKIHAFGHIHDGAGKLDMYGIHFVNASIMNDQYLPTNKPIVVDL